MQDLNEKLKIAFPPFWPKVEDFYTSHVTAFHAYPGKMQQFFEKLHILSHLKVERKPKPIGFDV